MPGGGVWSSPDGAAPLSAEEVAASARRDQDDGARLGDSATNAVTANSQGRVCSKDIERKIRNRSAISQTRDHNSSFDVAVAKSQYVPLSDGHFSWVRITSQSPWSSWSASASP